MPWTDVPVSLGDDASAWSFLSQFWKATRERIWLLANGDRFTTFPPSTRIYYTGKITDIDEFSLTDSGETWPIDWAHFTPTGGDDFRPASYDVVIDGTLDADSGDLSEIDEPRVVIQKQIDETDMSSQILYFDTSLADFVTANAIPSLDWLVGKTYRIMKRFATYWAERWPEEPNDNELASARFDDADATTSSIKINASSKSKPWTHDQLLGKDLIVYGDDDELHRVTITTNESDTLHFATQSWTPARGDLVVVEPDTYAWPARQAMKPHRWYTGLARQFWSHEPEDGADNLLGLQIRPGALPATTIDRLTGEFCTDPETIVVWDTDAQIDFDDPCNSPRDHFYSPYLYRSLRQLQVSLEAIAPNFVEPKSYSGANDIPNFSVAKWMRFAGIGETYEVAITGFDSGSMTFASLGAEFFPAQVRYAVYDGDKLMDQGVASVSDTSLSAGEDSFVGMTLVIAFGWTRYYPREFRYLFAKTCFIPDTDVNDITGETFVVDPPTSDLPGSWQTRPASTTYADRELHDFDHSGTPGKLDDGSESFVEEDVARFIGDNFGDTTLDDPVTEESPSRPNGMSPLTPYDDHFFVGQGINHRMASAGGVATSGSVSSLVDSRADFAPSLLIEHAGTPTSISTTSLADTGQAANGFWTTSDRLVGQILTIVQADGGTLDGVERPILTQDTATQAITFDTIPGLAATYTDSHGATQDTTYSIRESAYELGRWQGRTITLLAPTGETYSTTIATNGRRTIFFETPIDVPVEAGWSYVIREPKTGQVFLRRDSTWIKPPSDEVDPRDGSGSSWPDDSTTILPTRVKRFGRFMAGDDVSLHLFDELYDGINALVWTKRGYSWTANSENNVSTATSVFSVRVYGDPSAGHGDVSYDDQWDATVNDFNSNWDSGAGYEDTVQDNAPPLSTKDSSAAAFYPSTDHDVGRIDRVTSTRRFAYPVLHSMPTSFATAVEFFAFGDYSVTDPESDWPDKVINVFTHDGISLALHAWESVASLGADDAPDRLGPRCGPAGLSIRPSFSQPDDPFPHATSGPSETAFSRVHSGFRITDTIALVKWDVDGGLEYVAS